MKLGLVHCLAFIGCASLAMFAVGCPSVTNPACAVIKIADETCTVLAVPLPDGGTQTVAVSPQDLKAFAYEQQLKAAKKGDGGL
jgi:hypothetical protein